MFVRCVKEACQDLKTELDRPIDYPEVTNFPRVLLVAALCLPPAVCRSRSCRSLAPAGHARQDGLPATSLQGDGSSGEAEAGLDARPA
eukprot:764069-Hanusia_phi.AAC.4